MFPLSIYTSKIKPVNWNFTVNCLVNQFQFTTLVIIIMSNSVVHTGPWQYILFKEDNPLITVKLVCASVRGLAQFNH